MRPPPVRPLALAGLAALAPGALAALLLTAPPPAGAADEKSGEQIYRAACAACHAADGRGASRQQLGSETVPPDFTECTFSTREPDRDWGTVVRQGGPARAFSPLMPAFGEHLTEAEVERTVDYLRTFCRESGWPHGNLNMPRAMFTEKAFPEDEALLIVGSTLSGRAALSSRLIYETRIGAANQVELVVPFAFEDRAPGAPGGGGWKGGLGDVAAGVKRAFLFNERTGTILGLTAELIFPTGNPERAFGKGTWIFEPFLSAGQSLGPAGFLQAQVGVEIPFDEARAEQELFWRAVYGRTFVFLGGRIFSPMVELLGARALEKEASTSWDLVPQLQVALSKRQHVLANVAVRVPLERGNDRAPQLFVYLLWDWFDGGLFEGW